MRIICDIAYDINLRLKNKNYFLNSKYKRKSLAKKKEKGKTVLQKKNYVKHNINMI